MKNIKLTWSVLFIFFFTTIFSQSNNHPTISTLTINYKSLPQTTLSATTNTIVRVIPMATITLVNASLVSEVNFKIINATGAIEYESNYTIHSNTVSDKSGRKIFQTNGNLIYINVPREIISGTYSYNVFTKDNSNSLSPTYTLTY